MLFLHEVPNIADFVSQDFSRSREGWVTPSDSFSGLLEQVTPVLENLCGKHLEHAYSRYFHTVYGMDIPLHLDREQVCYQVPVIQDRGWSMTFHLGNAMGQVTLPMSEGFGHLYEGYTIPHECPAYQGHHSILLMLGYRYGKQHACAGSNRHSVHENGLTPEQMNEYRNVIESACVLNRPSEVMNQSCYWQSIVKSQAGLDGMVNSMSIGFVIDQPAEHQVRPMENACVLYPLDEESASAKVSMNGVLLDVDYGSMLLIDGYPNQFSIIPSRRSVWVMMPFRKIP